MGRFFNFEKHIGCSSSSISNTAMLNSQYAVEEVDKLKEELAALKARVTAIENQ